ncbi:MAG TPA: 1-acyl-sn-glycerol-3-phosphate acyltransferase [Polyangiaceae bacterium]
MSADRHDRLDGRDARLVARLLPIARALCRSYFRLQVEGEENLVATPTIYASNHNGGIAGPDLLCTLSALWSALGPDAPVYALAHDFAMRQLVPLGRVLQKLGAVRASQDNARRILESGASLLVYPGGDLEAYRHGRRRNEIVLGERSGFVRLAQRTAAPIVPVVAFGAHRSAYIFHEGEFIARMLRMKNWARLERFPIALALPWGIAPGPWLPYAPLPFRIRLRVLRAEHVDPAENPDTARERIRSRMQAALDDMRESER